MKRLIPLLLCLLLLAGCSAPASPSRETVSFIDDTGAQISAPVKPRRVAVLLSSLAEVWQTADGEVAVTVGETVERGFAPSGVTLVDDGAGKTINIELLIASQPDLVIYSAELAGQAQCAQTLAAAGIPAAGFTVETFADYLRVLEIFTSILQTPENYAAHGAALQARVEELIASVQGQSAPTVLFVRAGSSARFTKAKTAANHFVCGMLKELGCVNIADAAPILLDGLSIEAILLSDPDFILYTTMGDESAGTAYMESLLTDPVWQTLTAVQEGRVYQLPKALFQYKPGPRWDAAYQYLIDLLYGETT